jgi:hypothetical protein
MTITYDKDLLEAIETAKLAIQKFRIPHQIFWARGKFQVLPADEFDEIALDEIEICLVFPDIIE